MDGVEEISLADRFGEIGVHAGFGGALAVAIEGVGGGKENERAENLQRRSLSQLHACPL